MADMGSKFLAQVVLHPGYEFQFEEQAFLLQPVAQLETQDLLILPYQIAWID